MKNNILNPPGDKIIHRFDMMNSLIIFFLSVVAIYQIHFWTKGIILSSPMLTFFILLSLFVIFSIRIWPWMKLKPDYVKESGDWKWIIVGLLAIWLTVAFWIGRPNVALDYLVHKQFTLQLLNGALEGHEFYKGIPGYYPPVTHTTIAVFTNLSGLLVHYSFFLVSVLISFLIPLISYRLGKQLGFAPVPSLFFCSFISLYGGVGHIFWTTWLHWLPIQYLPAMQISVPFISRNITFLLFLLYITLCFRFIRSENLSYNVSINTGVLLGLIGLTQPHGFFVAILFIFIIYGTHFKMKCLQREVIFHLATVLLIGGALSLLYFVPLIYKLIYHEGLKNFTVNMEVFPTRFFWLYGPIPFLGLYAIWNKRKDMESWMVSSLLIIAIISLGRVFLGQIIPIGEKWIVFWIHRYGPYMFIFLSLLATDGFDNLLRLKKMMRYIITVVMIFTVLLGYITAYHFLDGWTGPIKQDFFPGMNKSEVIRTFLGNTFQESPNRIPDMTRGELFKKFLGGVLPERGIEKIRFQVPDPQNTLIVPLDPRKLAFLIASETGLNVSYVNPSVRSETMWKDKIAMTEEERFEMVDGFYKDLKKGILRQDVLAFFDTDIFLSSYRNLESRHDQLKKISSIIINDKDYKIIDKEYYLYKLNN